MIGYLNFLGYKPSEVVYLSEDETVYGAHDNGQEQNRNSGIGPVAKLTYPRDLSSLRNAWQPESLSITPADINGQAVKSRIIPFSLHDQTLE